MQCTLHIHAGMVGGQGCLTHNQGPDGSHPKRSCPFVGGTQAGVLAAEEHRVLTDQPL